jgi:hypothetical protein
VTTAIVMELCYVTAETGGIGSPVPLQPQPVERDRMGKTVRVGSRTLTLHTWRQHADGWQLAIHHRGSSLLWEATVQVAEAELTHRLRLRDQQRSSWP